MVPWYSCFSCYQPCKLQALVVPQQNLSDGASTVASRKVPRQVRDGGINWLSDGASMVSSSF